MTPTRKTSPRTTPTTAESEPTVESPEQVRQAKRPSTADARVSSTAKTEPAATAAASGSAENPTQEAQSPSAQSQEAAGSQAAGTTQAKRPAAKRAPAKKTTAKQSTEASAGASTSDALGSVDTGPAGESGVGATGARAAGGTVRDAENQPPAHTAMVAPAEPAPGARGAVRPAPETPEEQQTLPTAVLEPVLQQAGEPPRVESTQPPQALPPLSSTQLQNDPLLGTHDEIVVDLGFKLRWAAIGYALLGIVASWLIAAQVGIATKSGTPFAWALAATILIAAGAVWYIADVSTRFKSVAAYRKAKTPQAIARLDRGGIVGLYSVIGAWIGVAIGALVVVSGTVTAVLTIAFGASGWAWFFGAVPAVLLYLYSFGLLHYRLLEKARDAVA